MDSTGCRAARLLPIRANNVGCGAAVRESEVLGRGNRRIHVGPVGNSKPLAKKENESEKSSKFSSLIRHIPTHFRYGQLAKRAVEFSETPALAGDAKNSATRFARMRQRQATIVISRSPRHTAMLGESDSRLCCGTPPTSRRQDSIRAGFAACSDASRNPPAFRDRILVRSTLAPRHFRPACGLSLPCPCGTTENNPGIPPERVGKLDCAEPGRPILSRMLRHRAISDRSLRETHAIRPCERVQEFRDEIREDAPNFGRRPSLPDSHVFRGGSGNQIPSAAMTFDTFARLTGTGSMPSFGSKRQAPSSFFRSKPAT